MTTPTLDAAGLALVDGYWRAANYLAVGQIYLRDNPLLRRPLSLADVKRTLLGEHQLDMIYKSGPGHGGR